MKKNLALMFTFLLALAMAHNASAQDMPALPATPPEVALNSQTSSPIVGDWMGVYYCGRDATRAVMSVQSVDGKNFSGSVQVDVKDKNNKTVKGSYKISGVYDAQTGRALIKPAPWSGKGLEKLTPRTVMVGTFDSDRNSVSAVFQGITQCTSFEARLNSSLTDSDKKNMGFAVAGEKKPVAKKEHKTALKPVVTQQNNRMKDGGMPAFDGTADSVSDVMPAPIPAPATPVSVAPAMTDSKPAGR